MPNITGSFGGTSPDGQPSGAFRRGLNGYKYEPGGYKQYNWNFDASWCSSIYGNSAHVTPKNYTIRIWKRTV